MSSKKHTATTGTSVQGNQSTRNEAVPPPEGLHLDVLELAKCLLTVHDYLCSHHDDTVELSDELKPILERILR